MKKLIIFTLNGCKECRELKNRLTEQSIDFTDIEITLNRTIWEQVVKQTGFDILPTVFIQNDADESGTVYTPGRDFQDINEIIEKIKKNI